MSKRKGLSADEKKTRMMQIFHESEDFFQLKIVEQLFFTQHFSSVTTLNFTELEKIAPKEKGITMQSVKEVVQALVDDHMVDTEKIGTSIYFWAFPSKAQHAKKRKLETIRTDFVELENKYELAKDAIVVEQIGRNDCAQRREILKQLSDLQSEESKLKLQVQKYRDIDPEYMTQMKADTEKIKEAVNRWTGNIYGLKSYCKNKFSIDTATFDKTFGVPEELDYIDI